MVTMTNVDWLVGALFQNLADHRSLTKHVCEYRTEVERREQQTAGGSVMCCDLYCPKNCLKIEHKLLEIIASHDVFGLYYKHVQRRFQPYL